MSGQQHPFFCHREIRSEQSPLIQAKLKNKSNKSNKLNQKKLETQICVRTIADLIAAGHLPDDAFSPALSKVDGEFWLYILSHYMTGASVSHAQLVAR